MASRRSRIIGGDKVKRELQRRNGALRKQLKGIIKPPADTIRDAARVSSGFADKTGRLRKAIKTTLDTSKRNTVKFKVGPDPKRAPHGRNVELGHAQSGSYARAGGFVSPHPFMRPAFEQRVGPAERDIARGVKGALGL